MYRINEISKLTNISIRTLQHYDNIELLKATKKGDSNYRYYTDEDIEKLYQIMLLKELDFSLREIKSIMNYKNYDKIKALNMQKKLILKKRNRLDNIIKSIEMILSNEKGNTIMSKDNFKVFSYEEVENYKKNYEEEVKDKYKNTDSYKQSNKRTSSYSKEDWENITNEANQIYISLAEHLDKNPGDMKVQEIVQKWRDHITNNYYDCTVEIFRGLALMYISDERFTKNIDKFGSGLAQFLSDAMNVYCDNNKN